MSYLDVVGVEYAEESYAKKTGEYPNLTAGTAEGLIGQTYEADQSAYLYRKSHAGGRVREQIVGGTVAWNQLEAGDASNWVGNNNSVSIAYAEGVYTFTVITNSQVYKNKRNKCVTPGHRYYVAFKGKSSSADRVFNIGFRTDAASSTASNFLQIPAGQSDYADFRAIATPGEAQTCISIGTTSATPLNEYCNLKDFVIIDLTVMFGSTIADYIYSLEQSSAGAGVAWLKQYIDIDTYHAYNAGSLESVQTEGREVVGFNQWDEDNNPWTKMNNSTWRTDGFIPIISGQKYMFSQNFSVAGYYIYWYDMSKNKLSESAAYHTNKITAIAPNDAAFAKLHIYHASGITESQIANSETCFGFADSDPAKNGTYKPYEKHTYPVSNIVLRGIPKLIDGQIAFDGDVYAADGTVERRYGEYTFTDEETWEYNNTYGVFMMTKNIGAYRHTAQSGYVKFGIMSNGFSQYGRCEADMPDRVFVNNSTAHGTNKIYIKDTRYTAETIADFKASITGVKLTFLLATPTTETADPYAPVQAVGDTERWIDNRDVPVPVGQNSKYYPDYAEKIDRLPSDFSTLIAPTEETYTATRNYASGDYVIVNNILYYATAAISTGTAITPDSNCRAVTIMEIIKEILDAL